MPCSFEGLSEKRVRAVLGRALDLLAAFAEELADNRSFTDLLRTKEKEVKRSLGERPLRFPKLKGVELALPFIGDYEPPWPWQPWSHDLLDPEFKADSKRLPWRVPDRPGPENDGTEKIAIKIRWRGFRNSDIAEAMKRLAERERPQTEPESKQQEPKDTIRANLKALSVMRIWKRFPKARDLGKRIGEAAKYTDYASVRKEAIEYKKRRWEGRANTAISNAAQVRMHNARERAFRFFQDLFPGETPANLLKART